MFFPNFHFIPSIVLLFCKSSFSVDLKKMISVVFVFELLKQYKTLGVVFYHTYNGVIQCYRDFKYYIARSRFKNG